MIAKQLISLFIFCAVCNLHSQTDTLNQFDKDSLKQGYWKVYKVVNSEKTLNSEGRYLNNRKTGKWIEYYVNGNIKIIAIYNNGKPDGQLTCYRENGKISESGTWRNNRWINKYFLYSYNDNIQHEFNFNENGKREGKQLVYYEDGKLHYECYFKNGIEINDSCLVYAKDGKLEEPKVLDNYDEMGRELYQYRYINKTYFYDETKKFNDSIIKKIKH